MSSTERSQRSGVWAWLAPAALLAIAVWAYWPTLVRVTEAWASDPDYSHGYLVVPIALFFLWLRRDRRPRLEWGLFPTGLVLLAIAGLMRLVASRFYLFEIDTWSVPLWVAGVVWTLWGWPALRWALPSIAFLWFATPLPGTVALALSVPLQKLAAQLSGVALQICGLPAIVEGTTILLGDESLEVARACSGLRMFYGITALAFASIIIMRPGWWKAIAAVLAIAPVAVLMNVLRITATGVLTYSFPGAGIEKQVHDWAGLLVLPLAMLVFMGLLALFDRVATSWSADPRRTAPWLLGAAAGCIALVALGAWRYQTERERSLATLLTASARYEEEGDLDEAIRFLNRYTLARPEDAAEQVHLAELFAKAADTPGRKIRAVELLRSAYLADPSRRDLGIWAVELALETETFGPALELLGAMQADPAGAQDPELLQKRAEVLLAYMNAPQGQRQTKISWGDVAEALQDSLAGEGYPASHAVALAVVTRDRLAEPDAAQRAQAANAVINQLVAERPEDAEALFARYRYARAYGPAAEGFDPDADLDKALKHRAGAPPQPRAELLITAADRSRADDPAAARKLLEEAIKADPAAVPAYLALAELARNEGGPVDGWQEAVVVLRRGLAANEDAPLALSFGLAKLLVEGGEHAEAAEQIKEIRVYVDRIKDPALRGYARLEIAVVDAMQAARAKRTAQAAATLAAALRRADVTAAAEQRYAEPVADAWRRLAGWYAELDRSDAALAAWRRVVALAPTSAAAQAAVIDAAIDAGDTEAAVAASREQVQKSPDSGVAWLRLAQALLADQLRLPPASRKLAAVEQAAQKAAELKAPSVSLALAFVDLRRAQDRRPEAAQSLKRVLEKDPAQPEIWQSLATLEIEQENYDEALAAIGALTEQGGDISTAEALRATVLISTGRGPEAAERLAKARASARGDDQVVLTLLAAALERQMDRSDAARTMLSAARDADPTNLRYVQALAQYALADRDWAALAGWETKLRGLEGEEGTQWKACRALRLLMSGTKPDAIQLAECEKLAEQIIETRPRWATGPFLLSQVALQQGDSERGLAQLQRAWELGKRDSVSAEQMVALLSAAGRREDLERFAAELGDLPLMAPAVYDLVIPSLLGSARGGAALDKARQWAEENPEDPGAQLRLGRALLFSSAALQGASARSEQMSQAEAAFREAVRLGPDRLDAWMALFGFMLQTERPEGASEVISQFKQSAEIDPLPKQLALAQLWAASGQVAAAVHHWRAASDLAEQQPGSPQSAAAQAQAAAFFMNSSPPLAQRYCRQALASDPDAIQPRILLVQLLGQRRTPESVAEALELVGRIPEEPASIAVEKARLHALLLAERDEEGDIAEAISLIESLPSRGVVERRLLADLYEQAGRIGAAYEQLDELADERPQQIADLVRLLRFWQTHLQADRQFAGRIASALGQLGRLPSGLAEQLRWQLRLAATEQAGGATGEVGSADGESAVSTTATESTDVAAGSPAIDPEVQREVLGNFWRGAVARRALEDPNSAPGLLVGAYRAMLDEGCLAGVEATALNPPAQSISPTYAARLLANVEMMSPPADPAHIDLAEKLLDQQLAASQDDLALLRDAADLAAVTGRNERAESLYRRMLAVEPTNANACNNLASLWIEDPRRWDAARKLVEQGLAAHPDDASLLDTKGQLLLLAGEADAAVEALGVALRVDPSSATAHLHRARAIDEMGQQAEASEAVLAALALGIANETKLPADAKLLEQLREKFSL
ncbi:lipoprotein NlpI [Pirellulimonas nuda]|uniref:Lipoprotein NlpI n=1 Tax=Pirellulimonas nuda TaxID=2528009 RepID=A0A518DCZ2_9BACT|nr:exosortase [Pirellulimonas nuda]QDU89354.1 lipoprotein NlpI [Pirellulimonas nuda]